MGGSGGARRGGGWGRHTHSQARNREWLDQNGHSQAPKTQMSAGQPTPYADPTEPATVTRPATGGREAVRQHRHRHHNHHYRRHCNHHQCSRPSRAGATFPPPRALIPPPHPPSQPRGGQQPSPLQTHLCSPLNVPAAQQASNGPWGGASTLPAPEARGQPSVSLTVEHGSRGVGVSSGEKGSANGGRNSQAPTRG